MKISCASAILAVFLLSTHELPAAESAMVNANGMALGEVTATEAVSEKSGEDEEKCGVAAEADGFGDDVNKGDGEHVAGAESDEVLQELARPFAADNEIAAEEIAGRGNEAEGGGRSDAD